jgi:hypothetical protein
MKKYLPLILFVVGLGALTAAFFVFRDKKTSVETEETALQEVVLEERPVASLTPSEDGHWLNLKIEKIVLNATSFDYELLYKLPDGRTQGVPGTVKLDGQKIIERELLMGSESSGKFSYDEGVEQGTLTLRFRNERGKLLVKFSTQFHLQSDTKKLTSVDGNFSYTLTKTPSETFFVTMETFGLPGDAPEEVTSGPYGIFSSAETSLAGSVQLDGGTIYRWTGSKWQALEDGSSSDLGIFVTISD